MPSRKRKKFSRQRGSHTHGWGAKKKHRGAGNRGGKGMAGSGKRADQKKPTILKLYGTSYYGKHGFKRPAKTVVKDITINLAYLNDNADNLLKKNLAVKKADYIMIDLKKLGYTKLLGKGNLSRKFKIIVDKHSKNVHEKLKKSGSILVKEN